jgi:hypothetical protein
MQDRPNAAELLDAVASLLTNDVMPQLEGRSRFHVRVAANLLRILEREWRLEPEHRVLDQAALAGLLGVDASLEELSEDFVRRLRRGELDERDAEVLTVLRGITRRKLSVTNPTYLLEQPA